LAAAVVHVADPNRAGKQNGTPRQYLPRRAYHMALEFASDPMPNASKKRAPKPTRPSELRGVPASGRIAKLFVGQGHGLIRLTSGREVYFHRADMQEGTSINDFSVGDAVTCEVLDDRVSGARALRVARRRAGRR